MMVPRTCSQTPTSGTSGQPSPEYFRQTLPCPDNSSLILNSPVLPLSNQKRSPFRREGFAREAKDKDASTRAQHFPRQLDHKDPADAQSIRALLRPELEPSNVSLGPA